MVEIFYERQNGGLCRKHVLNAYYGKSKYSVNDFSVLCDNYDKFMIVCGYNSCVSSKNFDLIESNQFTIISYALYLENIYSILVPYTYLEKLLKLKSKSSLLDLVGNNCDFIFVFNENHIWGCGKHQGKWYNIDSISGVRQVNINSYDWKIHGFIIPCLEKRTIYELNNNVFEIKKYLQNKGVDYNNYNEMVSMLKILHDSNLLLDDLEILIAGVVSILRIITDYSNNTIIALIINNYQTFLKLFEIEKLNFIHIYNYIPDIIKNICDLDLNAFKIK
jgi:hypothetical protein